MIVNLEPMIDLGMTPDLAMRKVRKGFLESSDWTQMSDSPLTAEQRQAWADYRQALRDFPATWEPGPTADFPDPPVS